MGRVAPQKAVKVTSTQSANGPRAAKVQKHRKKHKVVLESADSNGDEDKLQVVVRKSNGYYEHKGLTSLPAFVPCGASAWLYFHSRGQYTIDRCHEGVCEKRWT